MENKQSTVIAKEVLNTSNNNNNNSDQQHVSTSTTTTTNVSTNNRLKYGRVMILLENPILSDETISKTPSMADGLEPEIENDLRITGCKLIQISGILLRLPQVAMATGQVLFQRFYYSKSFVRQPMEISAMACVVLASKVEEAPRRMRDVINVFHNMKQIRLGKPIVPMILDENYVFLKNQVIKGERRILKELGFCVHVKHPHKFIVAVAQILKNENNIELIQTAWNYMNDSLQTNVFVRFTPEAIACACIHLSSRILRVPLPTEPFWYELFNVDTQSIETICKSILMLYTRKTLTQEDLETKVENARKMVEAEKLKQKQLNSNLENINSPIMIDSHTNSPNSNSNQDSVAVSNKTIELKSIISKLVKDKTKANLETSKTQNEFTVKSQLSSIVINPQNLNDPIDNHSSISSSSSPSSHSSLKLRKSPINKKYAEKDEKTLKKSNMEIDNVENHDDVSYDDSNYQHVGFHHHNSSTHYYKNGSNNYDFEPYSSSDKKDRRKDNQSSKSRQSIILEKSPPRPDISSKIVTKNNNYYYRGYDNRQDYRDSSPRSPSSPYHHDYYSSSSRKRKHRDRDEERISSHYRDSSTRNTYDRGNYETDRRSYFEEETTTRSRRNDYYRRRSKSRSPNYKNSSSSSSSSRHQNHPYHKSSNRY